MIPFHLDESADGRLFLLDLGEELTSARHLGRASLELPIASKNKGRTRRFYFCLPYGVNGADANWTPSQSAMQRSSPNRLRLGTPRMGRMTGS